MFPVETFAAVSMHDPEQSAADSGLNGVVIDSIQVRPGNIFDTQSPKYDRWVYRMANRFHASTRERIIRAELLFEVGQPFDWDVAYETERNLRNRMALYDARVTPRRLDDGRLLVEVVTVDVWSLAGGMDVQSEGGETDYDFNLEERNLLGLNQSVTLHYTDLAKEKAFFSWSFYDARFAGRPLALQTSWSNGDKSNYFRLSLSRPFYSLSEKVSVSAYFADEGGRNDQYRDTTLLGQNSFDATKMDLTGQYRIGSRYNKLAVLLGYGHTDQKVLNTRIFGENAVDSQIVLTSLPQDSLFHAFRIGLDFTSARYRELKRIDAFTKVEDIPVGLTVVTIASQAHGKSTKLYDRYSGGASYTLHHRGGFAYLAAEGAWWLADGIQLRRKAATSFRWYYYRPTFMTLAVHASHLEDARQSDGDPLVLGSKTGLRGYDNRFLTGHRIITMGAESRFFPGLELLSAQLGGVIFVDAARVWERHEPFRFRDFYLSAGFGIRIAPERVSRGRPIRIDFAYSEKFGWTISASSGQYFSLLSDNFLLTSR